MYWVKRVLFLADRVSLVKQASKEFGKHLIDVQVINLLRNQMQMEGFMSAHIKQF